MRYELLFKPLHPSLEDCHAIATKLLQAAHGLLWRFLYVKVRLGVELVGIADDLLLDALRRKVLMRQRQVLTFYLSSSESGSCVPFCHSGMTGKALAAQDFPTQKAVTDVGLCAVTIDARSIDPNDADIMQHGSFPKERLVSFQLGMSLCNLQRPSRHITTMLEQHLLQRLIALAILMY